MRLWLCGVVVGLGGVVPAASAGALIVGALTHMVTVAGARPDGWGQVVSVLWHSFVLEGFCFRWDAVATLNFGFCDGVLVLTEMDPLLLLVQILFFLSHQIDNQLDKAQLLLCITVLEKVFRL